MTKSNRLDNYPFFAKLFLLLFIVIPSVITLPIAIRGWADGSAVEAWRSIFSHFDPTAFVYCRPGISGDCVTGAAWYVFILSVGPFLGIIFAPFLISSMYRELKGKVSKKYMLAFGVILVLFVAWVAIML